MQIDFSKILTELSYQPGQPMIFSSGLFMLLFTAFLGIYSFVYKNERKRILYLIAFSLFFYYKSSGWYVLLLLLATYSDFHIARRMSQVVNKAGRIALLVLSLSVNLGMLLYFKYTNFFFSMFHNMVGSSFDPFDIFLPVGISFFTFQSLSYTIDVYRRNLLPLRKITDYAFYITFFPQMVAGPIVRASDFIPQIHTTPWVTRVEFGRAIFLISTGLFKKAVISDYISLNFVDRIFDNPMLYTGLENLVGVYGYALQIYCDFSGYSDMAIGIALLMGYHLPLNFNSPYQSASITEFWRRWHISLSTWLRDYLYISLGGNRKGKIRTYINLFITMLLGGLWHGAALRFVLWGAMHGVALAVEKFFVSITKNTLGAWSKPFKILVTFHFVCFSWIFFRAENMEVVGQVLTQIFTAFNVNILGDFIAGYPLVLTLMAVGFVLHFSPIKLEKYFEKQITEAHFAVKILYLSAVIFIVIQLKSAEIQPFIYFQF